MRIGFVVYGGLDQVSGGFLYDRQVVNGLRHFGHTVEVVALPWWDYGRALAANLTSLPRQLERCDVVIEDELVHPAVFMRHRRLRAARVPIVSLVHNLASRQPSTRGRWLVRACERAYFRSVDGVVAVSESALRDVREEGGQELTATVAYAGRDHLGSSLDEGGVAVRAVGSGPLRLACVGVVAPHKGVHRLIDALARVEGEGTVLDVAGSLKNEPGYVRRLRAQVARLGLEKRVHFHGQLEDAALRAMLLRSHLFALPSDRESYPISAIEALGFGLPLLITSEGGTAEVLGGAPCGQLLRPDDIASWSAAIDRLGRDRGALSSQGQAALARYRAHGTWRETARGVLALCERVLTG
jgi:glycosyltransferase involved in cell wall biosynthesis